MCIKFSKETNASLDQAHDNTMVNVTGKERRKKEK